MPQVSTQSDCLALAVELWPEYAGAETLVDGELKAVAMVVPGHTPSIVMAAGSWTHLLACLRRAQESGCYASAGAA